MDKDCLVSSSDLLQLESKLASSESFKPDSLFVTKKAIRSRDNKRQESKPVNITAVDTTSILSRAKAFLNQIKDEVGEEVPSVLCDIQASDSDDESDESSDDKQPKVEVDLLLFPESAATKSTRLGKVTRLLGAKDDEDSEADSSSSSEDEEDRKNPLVQELPTDNA